MQHFCMVSFIFGSLSHKISTYYDATVECAKMWNHMHNIRCNVRLFLPGIQPSARAVELV